MTELSFLIELLLHHELTKETKDLIAARIKDVELMLTTTRTYTVQTPLGTVANIPCTDSKGIPQSPSTIAAMARHAGLPLPVVEQHPVAPPPEPVVNIAQTQAAAAAMASRERAIADSIAGKVDKVSGRPKKW